MNIHSGFVLSQTDKRPMYLQIIEQVQGKVAVGDWKPGDVIPSIRGLAVELKVSVITVKRAYLELERAGIIVTQQGKGSRISSDAQLDRKLQREELQRHLRESVRLGHLLGLDPDELVAQLRRTEELMGKRKS